MRRFKAFFAVLADIPPWLPPNFSPHGVSATHPVIAASQGDETLTCFQNGRLWTCSFWFQQSPVDGSLAILLQPQYNSPTPFYAHVVNWCKNLRCNGFGFNLCSWKRAAALRATVNWFCALDLYGANHLRCNCGWVLQLWLHGCLRMFGLSTALRSRRLLEAGTNKFPPELYVLFDTYTYAFANTRTESVRHMNKHRGIRARSTPWETPSWSLALKPAVRAE